MKFFNTLLIALMIPQLALANRAPAGQFDYILERTTLKLSERLVEEIAAQFNKQLKKPNVILKQYNRELGKIDKRLVLKRDDINHFKAQKAGSSSLHLYYSKADFLTADLSQLGRGEISFNGKNILWEDAQDPRKLYQFMEQEVLATEGKSKKVSGLFSWIVSDAHAVVGTVVGVFVGAAAMTTLGLLALNTIIPGIKAVTRERLLSIENNLVEAKTMCIASQYMLGSGEQGTKDNQETVMGTLRFIDEIEPFITQESDDNMFSCSHIKVNVVRRVKVFEVIPIYKIVGRVCELAEELEGCLNKTKSLANKRGVKVDDSSRSSKDKVPEAYRRIIENMNPSGALQR